MLLGYALRGVQVILLVLCAFLVYATITPHLRAAPVRHEVELTADVAAAPSGVALEHFSVIWKRNPFGKPRLVVAQPKPMVEQIKVESKLSWRLVTTAAGSPAALSVAGLVNNTDGSRRAVRIGDEIEGRDVVGIERGRVILSHRGKLEQLSIEKDAKKASRSARARRSAKRPGIRPVPPRLGNPAAPWPCPRREPRRHCLATPWMGSIRVSLTDQPPSLHVPEFSAEQCDRFDLYLQFRQGERTDLDDRVRRVGF